MIIKGIVSGQTLVVCPAENLAEGTVNAICAEFTFSPEWRGLAKTAFFMRGADGPYQAPISSDGTIAAAAGHLNFGAGLWKVSVAGERFEDGKVVHRLTTGVAHFVVSGSIVDPEGQPFPGVPPTGQGAPGKPALIGDNGNWLIYNIDLEEYVDTGLPSRGPEGPAGKDGYTPVKGVDYFDGAPGAAGPEGPAGPPGVQGDKGDPLTVVGRTHVVAETEIYPDGTIFERRPAYDILTLSDGTVLDISPGTNGTKGADGASGLTPYVGANGNWWLPVTGLPPSRGTDTGKPSRGEDGTSVAITNISESTESGGTSVVTFSDGKTLSVRNGLDGQGGSASDVTEADIRGMGFAYKSEVDSLKEEIKSIEIGGTGLDSGKLYYLCKALKGALFDSVEASNAAQAFIASVTGESAPDIPDEPAEITLTGITAVYSGGDVLEGTQASDIDGITVTAHYSDGTTEVINTWTITGVVAVGVNTFTITYRDKSATVTVNGISEQSATWVDVEMETLTGSTENITDVYAGADMASTNLRTRANGLYSKISAEVFDRDTKVKIAYTATNSSTSNNNLYCGCYRYSKDTMIASDNHNVFYGVIVASRIASGTSGEFEYTVKAGYRLAAVNHLGAEYVKVSVKKEVI